MRRLLVAVPILLLALGIATACVDDGGEGVATVGGDGNGDSVEGELTEEEQEQEFTECMREQGIDLPDPGPNGEGGLANLRGLDIPREELQPALEACRDKLNLGGERQQLDQETLDQMGEFAQCMRDHGIDVPDPDPNGGFGLGGADIDPDDPDFQAALEACEEYFVGLRGGR